MSRTAIQVTAARLILLLGLLAATSPCAAGSWFRSNAEGDELSAISATARREHSWVLHVDRSPHEIVRALYHNGTLISEHRFTNDGALIERYQYRYRDGRRSESHAFCAADEPLHSDYYTYSSDGMLREIRRRYADNRERSSRYVFVRGRLHEELHHSGQLLERIRYDRLERLQQLQQLRNDVLTHTTRYYYRNDGPELERTVEEQHDADGVTLTSQYFDEQQRSIRTTVSRDGRVVLRSERSWGTHGIIEELEVEAGRQRVTSFEYNDDGTLALQQERLNDRLQSRIIYKQEGRRVEERFQNGVVVLRLFYRNGEVETREIIRDGEVIRTR